MSVVAGSEAPQTAFHAYLSAPPKRMNAVDSHGDRLEPLSDVVRIFIVEVTAQTVPNSRHIYWSVQDRKRGRSTLTDGLVITD